MFTTPMELTLAAGDREDLTRLIRVTSTPAGIARRARCVVLLGGGDSYSAICTALDVTDRIIAPWKRRFLAGGWWRWPTRPEPGGRTTD